MKVCVKCKKVLRCTENGVGIDWGHGHVYPADRYECPACGYEVLLGNSNPVHDEYDGKLFTSYLKMENR